MDSPAVQCDALEAGQRIDVFQIMRLLGSGGMGEVYLARDTTLGRKVALKVLRAGRPLPGGSRRMLDEAQAIARFSHPNIVTVYSFGEHHGRPYVALEYVDGPSLRERMRAEPPSLPETMRIGLAVAQALSEAHRHQVLHCDLKPENVLLARDGRPRVVDFGLARLLEVEPPNLGSAHERAGTPSYMAPEQWLLGAITGATDVWALGVMLYELVTGRHPFAAASIEELGERVISGRAIASPQAAGLPEALAELLVRCLDRVPARRPAATEIAATLQRLLTAARPIDESPFRGLAAFGERHAALFFGRDAEIAAFVEQLREQPVMTVVGPSGAGKSSFIEAGVIPRLREQGAWLILTMRPGDRPFRALAHTLIAGERAASSTPDAASPSPDAPTVVATAPARTASPGLGPGPSDDEQQLDGELRRTPGALALALRRRAAERGGRVLLFVDQLEELYTLVADGATRTRFLDAVLGAADDALEPVRVCCTVRDDFFVRLGETADVRAALSRVTVLRTPEPEALRDILRKPLQAAGYAYDDPTMVDEMIAAVEGEPAGLPLLQFALRLLWERRDEERRLLLRSAYRQIGGVAGALAEHADGVLGELLPDEVRTARELLLRLVTPEGTRRRLPRARLLHGLSGRAELVLAHLVESRLVSSGRARGGETDDAEIELAHESLMRSWPRLARWIEEGKDELAFLGEVGQAAELWDRRGRRADEAWQGETLEQAERTRARLGTTLLEPAAAFLEAGRDRQRRQRRRRRVLQAAGVASLVALTLVSIVVATSFGAERRTARQQRDLAEHQRADAQREAARAALGRGDLLTARASLRASLETEDTLVARALAAEISRQPLVWDRELPGFATSLAFAPDGKAMVVGSLLGRVYLVDAQTAAIRQLAALDRGGVEAVAFDPRGGRIAAGDVAGQVALIEIAGGALRLLGDPSSSVYDLEFSPDGHSLAVGDERGEVRLLDVASGGTRWRGAHAGTVNALAFSPDGRRVASGGVDETIRLWRIDDGGLAAEWSGQGAAITSLVFHPREPRLLAGGSDGSLRVLRLPDGQRESQSPRHRGEVRNLQLGADGQTLASSGDDGLRVGRLGSPESALLDSTPSSAMAWSRETGMIAVLGFRRLRLLDASRRPTRGDSRAADRIATGATFTPDGQSLVTGVGSLMRVWDVPSGTVRRELSGHVGMVLGLTLSRDGTLAASSGMDGTMRIREVTSGFDRIILSGSPSRPVSASFDPSTRLVAVGRLDGTASLLDLETGAAVRSFRAHGSWARVTFDPEGKVLATTSLADTRVELWDVGSGQRVLTLEGHRQGVRGGAAFSPDGRWLATGDMEGVVRVWDRRTGRGRTLGRQDGNMNSVAFDAAGERLVTAGTDGVARIWDLASGSQLPLRGHDGEINGASFSPDGRLVATAGDDGTVRVWHAASGRPFWRTIALFGPAGEVCTHRGCEIAGVPVAADSRWRRALAAAQTAAVSGGTACILGESGVLEAWDTERDARRFAQPIGEPREVLAVPRGCVALVGRSARLLLDGGAPSDLDAEASAVAIAGDEILVASSRSLALYSAGGEPRARLPAGGLASALTRVDDAIVAAHTGGGLEIVPLAAGASRRSLVLVDAPPSAVTRLAAGPRGTLIVGFADGSLGLWSDRSGVELARWQLHGPVREVALGGRTLTATSELGDTLTEDLGLYTLEYCELMRQVWSLAPITLLDGVVVVRPPPSGHRCAPSSTAQRTR